MQCLQSHCVVTKIRLLPSSKSIGCIRLCEVFWLLASVIFNLNCLAFVLVCTIYLECYLICLCFPLCTQIIFPTLPAQRSRFLIIKIFVWFSCRLNIQTLGIFVVWRFWIWLSDYWWLLLSIEFGLRATSLLFLQSIILLVLSRIIHRINIFVSCTSSWSWNDSQGLINCCECKSWMSILPLSWLLTALVSVCKFWRIFRFFRKHHWIQLTLLNLL